MAKARLSRAEIEQGVAVRFALPKGPKIAEITLDAIVQRARHCTNGRGAAHHRRHGSGGPRQSSAQFLNANRGRSFTPMALPNMAATNHSQPCTLKEAMPLK